MLAQGRLLFVFQAATLVVTIVIRILQIQVTCNYEKVEGSSIFEKIPNPVSVEKLEAMLQPFKKLHSVSLTGGEPLLHADFIKNLNLSSPLYLESNMTLPKQAKKICEKVTYVAGDFKLPEAIREIFAPRPGKSMWKIQ